MTKRRRVHWSLLEALPKHCLDVFYLIAAKLDDQSLLALSHVSRAVRVVAHPLVQARFVAATRRLHSPDRIPPLLRLYGNLDDDSFCGERRQGRPVGEREGLIIRSNSHVRHRGVYAWEHFPGEASLLEELEGALGHDLCWLSTEWKLRRQAFVNLCESGDVQRAFEACGKLRHAVRRFLRVDGGRCCCLPMEAWWLLERRTMDYCDTEIVGISMRVAGTPWAAVHVESITYALTSHHCSEDFLQRNILCYHDPNNHEHVRYAKAHPGDPSLPEIISTNLYWIPVTKQRNWIKLGRF